MGLAAVDPAPGRVAAPVDPVLLAVDLAAPAVTPAVI
jgi:hypothetical protein